MEIIKNTLNDIINKIELLNEIINISLIKKKSDNFIDIIDEFNNQIKEPNLINTITKKIQYDIN